MEEFNSKSNSNSNTFAGEFKPVFSASKLGEICSPRSSEATKIRFLRSFRPFSEIKLETSKSPAKKTSIYKPKVLLSEAEKSSIKAQLDANIDLEKLKFDDEKIIESFNESLSEENQQHDESLTFLMRQLLITDDEDEDGANESPESAYLTAQSDEECFKKYCDKALAIETKSKQAVRYISNMRGRKMERSILDKINQEYIDYEFVSNKSKKYVDYGNFKIVGIIDGWSVVKKTILEIKTRKNFEKDGDTITKRERMQAMTYMNMFACDSCLFVESGPKGELKKTLLDYDENVFNTDIRRVLDEFTQFARRLDRDEFKNLLIRYNIC